MSPRVATAVVAVALTLLAAAPDAVAAQASRTDTLSALPLDLTLLDAPYNTSYGARAPSMLQALDATTATYEAVHAGLQRALETRHPRLAKAAVVTFDAATILELVFPLTDVWVHEEFHRSALGARGVGSFDDVYRFRAEDDAVAVSHVSDDALVRLKRDHPADIVRAAEAGIEGELSLVQRLETNRFAHDSHAWNAPLLWIAKLSVAGYVASATWKDTEADVDTANAHDGANVKKRDWVGHDFTAWTYDLHRPDEPYIARGVHPSGVGIDRYIKPSDLTPAERGWARRMARFQLLDFVDPFLVGFDGVALGRDREQPLRATMSLGHWLTTFGHTVDANVFLRRGGTGALVTLHAYENGVRWLPGLDAQLFERPLRGAAGWTASPRVALWVQPRDQRFDERAGRAGGLVSVRVRPPAHGALGAFAEAFAKSDGWVAGVPQLDATAGLRVGATWRLGQ